MLRQRHGRYVTGPMQTFPGLGAMFQVHVAAIQAIRDALAALRAGTRSWSGTCSDIWRLVG